MIIFNIIMFSLCFSFPQIVKFHVSAFYTEDMYKMMSDTRRQLDESIGPAVPVCIASGLSPRTHRKMKKKLIL